MTTNFKILIFVSILLFVGSNANADTFPDEVSFYYRSPSGFLIQSPVNFLVKIDYWSEWCADYPFWNIKIYGTEYETDDENLPNIASSTLTLEKEFDLPDEDYLRVGFYCYETSTSTQFVIWQGYLEYDDWETIFRVAPFTPAIFLKNIAFIFFFTTGDYLIFFMALFLLVIIFAVIFRYLTRD